MAEPCGGQGRQPPLVELLQAGMVLPFRLTRMAYELAQKSPLIALGLRVVRVFPLYFFWDAPLHLWRLAHPPLARTSLGRLVLLLLHLVTLLFLLDFLLSSLDVWREAKEDLWFWLEDALPDWLAFGGGPATQAQKHAPKLSVFRRLPLPFSLVSGFMEMEPTLWLDQVFAETFGRSLWWAFLFAPAYLYLLSHIFVDQNGDQTAAAEAFFPLAALERYAASDACRASIVRGLSALSNPAAYRVQLASISRSHQGQQGSSDHRRGSSVLHGGQAALRAVLSWFVLPPAKEEQKK